MADVKTAKGHRSERLRRLGSALLVVVGTLSVGGAIFVVSGVYNVAASRDHLSITNWLLTVVRDRSIAAASSGISVPDLVDNNLADLGAEHYRGACAACHGVPGQGTRVVYQNMLPAPPDLISAYEDYNSRELFWIIYNGLKFTGMPAWPGDGRSDEVWTLVAFLDRLRREGADSYTQSERSRVLPMKLEVAGVAIQPLENCVRCHGDAQSPPVSDHVPRLHGQSEAYLTRAIENYSDGIRESGIMEPIALEMSTEETAALARYYASLPSLSIVASEDLKAVVRGRRIATEGLAEGGIPPCSSCHKGDNAQFPRLAGQSATYLRGQLELWRRGLRDRSGYGAIMAVVANRLNDAQIHDVTAFYASQPAELDRESEAPIR
ncbi:c-type cytochrome [Nitrosospira briensis]|uniref:c-type cytochrome n=1 Tax=Nitrosospira briensis TaxID=35799 RepID=UPI0008E2B32F|nr:c-type cytochrome [Nitrosospira briensis]SFO36229.1 Cytochrome c553 [Nitrosospira briensis]